MNELTKKFKNLPIPLYKDYPSFVLGYKAGIKDSTEAIKLKIAVLLEKDGQSIAAQMVSQLKI